MTIWFKAEMEINAHILISTNANLSVMLPHSAKKAEIQEQTLHKLDTFSHKAATIRISQGCGFLWILHQQLVAQLTIICYIASVFARKKKG